MIVDEVKEYLMDFQKGELPGLIERDLKIADTNKIVSIIGPRRAGKTFFLYQKIKHLLEDGIKKENIVYLNFEEPRLIGIGFKEVRETIKLQWQLYPASSKSELYIFMDEPQNIKDWAVAVRGLHDEGFKIFLTGSSSKLLSREIATSLRGRTLSYLLLPFSFREYLKAKKLRFDIARLSSVEKASLLQQLDKYLEYGGFPEIILEQDSYNRMKIISEYFNLVVYKDIVERYNIRNTQLIRWVIKTLINSFSGEFSIHKAYLSLKSQGIRASKNTLYSYLSLLEDSVFIFTLQKFSRSIRKKQLSLNKVYLCDTAFANVGEISKNIGKRMENLVFLELARRAHPLGEIFYWKNLQQEEVDFLIKEKTSIKELMQVCYEINNITTKQREIRALLKAATETKCKNLTIITYDHEGSEEASWFNMRGKIIFIPLWKFLLEE
ncbi:hypothetical protein COT48_01620 [Candidatus Woesearchaeota archaeon CG08_land_8_20_14_0_20_47_9]|nr:MAG: hypothetical protein AUJ69_00215 [Candidatus Woesearchaeota archaeon CG1_02_47_18]PIO04208.1 MAG: hypothetical protein COT48_01620 [Candidatus Woesearchaeota archaeon CG08_land_8_20_14_0_20_47_9]HII30015.1 ATP-binding protein [Candidatus Woesearchaeota archaeon]